MLFLYFGSISVIHHPGGYFDSPTCGHLPSVKRFVGQFKVGEPEHFDVLEFLHGVTKNMAINYGDSCYGNSASGDLLRKSAGGSWKHCTLAFENRNQYYFDKG